jgi:hypothetical protein
MEFGSPKRPARLEKEEIDGEVYFQEPGEFDAGELVTTIACSGAEKFG